MLDSFGLSEFIPTLVLFLSLVVLLLVVRALLAEPFLLGERSIFVEPALLFGRSLLVELALFSDLLVPDSHLFPLELRLAGLLLFSKFFRVEYLQYVSKALIRILLVLG